MTFRGVSLALSIVCVVFFVLQSTIPGFTESLLLNEHSWSQPWRFVTSLFLHGDLAHLLFNLFALLLFGFILESLTSAKKAIIIFFSAGIVANLIAVNFYPSSLGASGAIFGIIGALIVIRPGMVVFAFGLPMPMIVAGILWAVGDIIGIFVPSNVGNIAHLAGMAVGLLVGAFLRQPSPTQRRNSLRIDEHTMRSWEETHL